MSADYVFLKARGVRERSADSGLRGQIERIIGSPFNPLRTG
jgi:hypothetical protein